MERTFVSTTIQKVGETVVLKGWVDTKRDHGKLTFIELRDHTGQVQCVGFNKMGELTVESVVEIVGKVNARPEHLVNPKVKTGTIEIEVESYTVLNKATVLPLQVEGDGKKISEEIRLKYRYLDLRRQRMQKIVKLRSDYSFALRKALHEQDFTEVETPVLSKATMEGARDFLVPSRFQPGKFYALPQSPQQYKQLLMSAGFYRYFQFARCFRDEDLRADRGFEFTQLDMELSYVTRDEVMQTIESIVTESVKAVGGKLKTDTFPVYTYEQANKQFGEDKFDLRTEAEKEAGVLAFAWVVDFPMFKKVNRDDAAEVRDSKSGWTFTHNPFGAPKKEHLEWHMNGENIEAILTDQYDLVCNGYEVGGGSIRAHDPEVLKATYKIMGYDDATIQASIGHMLEAFSYGTPPHGGIALGLDRLTMLLANEESLKETIAFPMTSTGRTAVMEAPAPVSAEVLSDLGLVVKRTTYQSVYDHVKALIVKTKHQETEQGQVTVKSMVLDLDDKQVLYVLPVQEKIDFKNLKQLWEAKKVQMADPAKVENITKVAPRAVPPFGSTVNLPTFIAKSLQDLEEITFTPGILDKTITLNYQDFIAIEKPTII